MLTAILLLAATTMTFPLGVVEIPEGCAAPAQVSMAVDGFMASIDCPKGFSISLYGDVYMRPPCTGLPPGSKGTQGAPDRILLKEGPALPVCVYKHRQAGSTVQKEETLIDLGSGLLRAEIRTPAQLSYLRRIAQSFRRAQNGDAK